MNLHLDHDSFKGIMLRVSNEQNIRADILEKDYYVTLLLYELSKKQCEIKAYFKGGTALYKALRSIKRFSEDIDLTVYIEDCASNNQSKKRLEVAVKGYTSMDYLPDDVGNENHKGAVTAVYGYQSQFSIDEDDALQRFGKVKVEGTSFTVSEPIEKFVISPLIYDMATEQEREILEKQFEVKSFLIDTIKLERIFADKVFATEFYYTRGMYFDTAKHIYDLIILYNLPQIQNMLKDKELFHRMTEYKRKEELVRKGGIDSTIKIGEFKYLHFAMENEEFKSEYEKMQNIYIFDEHDKLELKNATDVFDALKEIDF